MVEARVAGEPAWMAPTLNSLAARCRSLQGRGQRSGRQSLAERLHLPYAMAVDLDNLAHGPDIYAVCVHRVLFVTPLSLDLTSRLA